MRHNNHMKNKYIFGLVLLAFVCIVGWWLFGSGSETPIATVEMSEEIDRSDLGISFRQPKGYELRQLEGGLELNGMTMQGAFTISSTSENLPVISGFVFKETPIVLDESDVLAGVTLEQETDTATATEKLSKEQELKLWAEKNEVLTNFTSLESDTSRTEVDGITALEFVTQGSSFKQDMRVVDYRGRTFLLVGQYESIDDVYHKNFKTFIESFLFL